MAPRGSFLLLEENGGAGKRLRADNDQPVFEEPPADTPSPPSPSVAPARGPPSPPFAAAACTPETSPCEEQRGGQAGIRTRNSYCFLFPSTSPTPPPPPPPLPPPALPITPDTAGPRAREGFMDLTKRSPSPIICFFFFSFLSSSSVNPTPPPLPPL